VNHTVIGPQNPQKTRKIYLPACEALAIVRGTT
jgi:hypothetical protein